MTGQIVRGELASLPTPCLLLDRAKLDANCRRMREIAQRHGVRLRPHLKTCKSIDVANVALGDAAFRGGTVSTLDEAAYFAERGIRDLTYAVGITADKLDRVVAIERASGARVGILTDDLDTARAIAAHDVSFRASIEIDSGQHRGGVDPESSVLIEIGRALGDRLIGVLTHAGHSYGHRGHEELARIAEEERSAAVRAAEHLRAHGIACPQVSVGSTPTAMHARHLEGVTELRPGVYVFGDLFQAAIGACDRDDLALSVLASVIVHRDGQNWIDAGALALTQDRSMDALGGGYGEVVALDRGASPHPARVEVLHQVHGRVAGDLPVGARVRIYPNHACLTAAMFDRYFVEDQGRVVAEWPRLRG